MDDSICSRCTLHPSLQKGVACGSTADKCLAETRRAIAISKLQQKSKTRTQRQKPGRLKI